MAGNIFPVLNSFWLRLCHASTYYNLNSLNNTKNIPDISFKKQAIVCKTFVMGVSDFLVRFEFRVSDFEFRVSSFGVLSLESIGKAEALPYVLG